MTRKKPARKRERVRTVLYFLVSSFGVSTHSTKEEARMFQSDIKRPTRIFKGFELPTKERKGDE